MIIRNLFIDKRIPVPCIEYVQNTNAANLRFNLMDYEPPAGAAARVYVERSDGTAEYDTAVLTTVTIGGVEEEQREIYAVEVEPSGTLFGIPGPGVLQVQIINSGATKVFVSFPVPVRISWNRADGTPAGNATNIFQEYLADLAEAIEEASPVMLRKTNTDIQWKREAEEDWTNLCSLDDIRGPQGDKGDPGERGPAGIGIVSITKTGTAGNMDTYTITMTDGSTAQFTVTNGTSIITVTDDGDGNVYMTAE